MRSRAKETARTWVHFLGAEHTGPDWGARPLPTSLVLSKCPNHTPAWLSNASFPPNGQPLTLDSRSLAVPGGGGGGAGAVS